MIIRTKAITIITIMKVKIIMINNNNNNNNIVIITTSEPFYHPISLHPAIYIHTYTHF